MAIKVTGYPPLPHTHSAVQVEGLGFLFGEVELQSYGAPGRDYAPFCRIVCNSNIAIANAVDVWMGGGFSTAHDNAAMVKLAGDASGGGDTTKTRIVAPISGFYRVSWKYYMDGLGSSVPNAVITINDATSVTTGSLVLGQGAANGWASPTAMDVVYLNAGDRLYFTAWQNSGATRTLFATWFNNAKTSMTAQWIGR